MKVIHGGTLIDGTCKDSVPSASMAIDDGGRIIDVGTSLAVPRGAQVIDAHGMTIMPGIIDCHVHLLDDTKPMQEASMIPLSLRILQSIPIAKATLDAGVTTVRDADGIPQGFKTAAQEGIFRLREFEYR